MGKDDPFRPLHPRQIELGPAAVRIGDPDPSGHRTRVLGEFDEPAIVIPSADFSDLEDSPWIGGKPNPRTPSIAANLDPGPSHQGDFVTGTHRETASEQPHGLGEGKGAKTQDLSKIGDIAATSLLHIEVDRRAIPGPCGQRDRRAKRFRDGHSSFTTGRYHRQAKTTGLGHPHPIQRRQIARQRPGKGQNSIGHPLLIEERAAGR